MLRLTGIGVADKKKVAAGCQSAAADCHNQHINRKNAGLDDFLADRCVTGHDAGIVDQMKRRVIELVAGQVVRDERQGGYQTQAIPVAEVAR